MVTRKDVAKKAGVSTATVSYVLNGKPGVSEATRQKVCQAMKELGYQPSYAARALRTKRTNHLSVFVNNLVDPFEAGILNHVESHARMRGYFVTFQTYKPDDEEAFLHDVTGRIDGLLLLGQSLKHETMDTLQSLGIPVVSIMEPVRPYGLSGIVDIDWQEGMRRIVQHLVKGGHRKIGFVANGKESHPHERRKAAFLAAMQEAGLPCGPDGILYGAGSLEQTKALMAEHIGSGRLGDYTAFVAASDLMAVGMLSACREAGIRVPGELAVAGCENILMTEQTTPDVTVLDYPRPEAARLAVDMIIRNLQGEPAPDRCTLECQILVRGSSVQV